MISVEIGAYKESLDSQVGSSRSAPASGFAGSHICEKAKKFPAGYSKSVAAKRLYYSVFARLCQTKTARTTFTPA
jgi:hypothetical protein